MTLTELLVVIAIIATLMALLLPAVQSARETARCLACRNNLKELGAAMQSYLQSNDAFPAGSMSCPTSDMYGHSWWVHLLPFLEQRTLFDQLDKTGRESGAQYRSTGYVSAADPVSNARNRDVLNNVVLTVGKCPSGVFSPLSPLGPNLSIFVSDYVGIAGSSDHHTAFGTNKFGAGVVSSGGLLVPRRVIKPAHAKDGLSNTLLLGEQSDYCSVADGTKADCRSSCFHGFAMAIRSSYPTTDPRIFNLTTVRYSVSKDASLANSGGNCGANSPLQAPHYAGPNALFGDGSVRLVGETTVLAVLKAMADRDDGFSAGVE